MWKRWTFTFSCFSAFALKVGTRRNGHAMVAELKTTSRICSMRRSLVLKNGTSEFHASQGLLRWFCSAKNKHGFQLSTSRKCIHSCYSCFLFSIGSFSGATFVAEACCVSFVSHRSPGSAAFAYSCQERLCTGRLGKHPEFNLLN